MCVASIAFLSVSIGLLRLEFLREAFYFVCGIGGFVSDNIWRIKAVQYMEACSTQMALLFEGFFYKTCAMYPSEVSEESPCKSMAAALINTSVDGIPIRVMEDTTMWSIRGVKVGKPHSCYLARYDPVTSIGVIFLGMRSPAYSHRFVPVHGGVEHNASQMLTTVPPAAFSEVFYLNLSHPLRVRLLYVPPPKNLNLLRRSRFGLGTLVGPPPVGITEYQNLVPRLLVSLDDVSRQTFWELYKAYHTVRPTRRTSLGLEGGGTPGGSAGAASGSVGASVGSGGASAGGRGVSFIVGEGGGAVAAGGGGPGESGSGRVPIMEDAPWGRIGKLRIGIDIPCIVDDGSDDGDASDNECLESEENAFILDGELVVSDFFFGIDNMIAMS